MQISEKEELRKDLHEVYKKMEIKKNEKRKTIFSIDWDKPIEKHEPEEEEDDFV